LGLAKPYPVTDPCQLFDSYSASGAFSLGHDALGYLMVHLGSEARLFAAPALEQATRRACLLGL
jgi:hypothetical protein